MRKVREEGSVPSAAAVSLMWPQGRTLTADFPEVNMYDQDLQFKTDRTPATRRAPSLLFAPGIYPHIPDTCLELSKSQALC